MVTPLTPDEILRALAAPITTTRKALDDGVSFADSTLDGQPYCAHTWASLVRYRARNRLIAEWKSTDKWHVKKFRNSGFAISLAPFSMRTLKAQQSGPPHPGVNLARREYWQQIRQERFTLPGDEFTADHAANLILDWKLGANRDVIIALSKPEGIWRYKGEPRIEWRLTVSFDERDLPVFVPSDEDVPVAAKYDLDELGTDAADS